MKNTIQPILRAAMLAGLLCTAHTDGAIAQQGREPPPPDVNNPRTPDLACQEYNNVVVAQCPHGNALITRTHLGNYKYNLRCCVSRGVPAAPAFIPKNVDRKIPKGFGCRKFIKVKFAVWPGCRVVITRVHLGN